MYRKKIEITPEEWEEIEKNVKWFSRLDPIQKIKAVSINNQALRRLLGEERDMGGAYRFHKSFKSKGRKVSISR